MLPAEFLRLLILSFFIFLSAEGLMGRQNQISHQDYMSAIGMEDDYIVMGNILLRGLQIRYPGNTSEYYVNNASFFSMILLLSKVTPITYYRLEENDVDVIHAISAEVRPLSEQSLLSDVVVKGTVTSVETTDTRGDGFDVSVIVSIDELLKGAVPGDKVTIRQRNINRLADSQTRPEKVKHTCSCYHVEFIDTKKQTINSRKSAKPGFLHLLLVKKRYL